MWNLILVRLETVLVSVHDRCTVCAIRVLDTMMLLLCVEAQVVLISVYLEIVLSLTQDRCTVCAERTMGSEIVLDAPDGTPR